MYQVSKYSKYRDGFTVKSLQKYCGIVFIGCVEDVGIRRNEKKYRE